VSSPPGCAGRGSLARVALHPPGGRPPWSPPRALVPSPAHAAWRLGPLPVRAFALCVIAGIGVAVLVTALRYRRAGGRPGVVLDVAAWAIPFGLIGALAHAVLIDTRHLAAVGAVGVPGAVALGTAGAWIACRRADVQFSAVAGAAAPAVAFGLAIGGLGNWWAQQFYGPPSTWLWAVQISPEHRVPGYEDYGAFQPVFAYQSLWNAALGFGLIWAARRFALSGQRAFVLCAAGYAAGAFWADMLRIGPVPRVWGMRFGVGTDMVLFAAAVVVLYMTRSRPRAYEKPGQVTLVDDSSGDVMST
jgi:prolipoprotein diacylglyceryltransferase